MIHGSGSENPIAVLVADYAQGEDLKYGYALSGYKESVLKNFSKQANISYDHLYKTSLLKIEPEKLDIGTRRQNSDVEFAKAHLDAPYSSDFKHILIDEIRSLRPNLVVPLGEMSFQFLTGLKSIRKFRGSILRLDAGIGIDRYTKVLPILGPYPYLYEDYKQKFISQWDFNKIPKWSNEKPIPDDSHILWVAESFSSLRNFMDRSYQICASKKVEEGGYLVFDIETYLNIPTCISFCFDGKESCCVPFLDPEIPIEQRALMMDLVAKLLDSPIPKVNQNIKFDWKSLERFGFPVRNVVGDPMIAANCIYSELPKNLGFLTSIYTDIPYFKDEGNSAGSDVFLSNKGNKRRFYLYNAKDSLAAHQILKEQLSELRVEGTLPVYQKLMKLIPIYKRMEQVGIRIDEEKRQELLNKYLSLFDIHRLVLENLTGEPGINPLSSKSMNRLIFEVMQFGKIRGVTGSDETSLNMLLAFGQPKNSSPAVAKEILQEISWCRRIHKVIEILELDIYPDNRFRCEYNLAGTETGRTSAGKTTDYFIKELIRGTKQKVKIVKLGHSLQTIGKHGFKIDDKYLGTDIRHMFVPSNGCSFVEIDLSGAEARVDRILSGNFDLAVFDNPGIHKLTGSWVFNCEPGEIKKGTNEYHLAKTVRHAGERNMGANRFFLMAQDQSMSLNLSLKEAQLILDRFHSNEPQIKNVFHRQVEECIKESHCLVAPNGRKRYFLGRPDQHTINEGISSLPQAIVSDQTKFSFIPTSQEAPWGQLLAESHDGSLWEVPQGRELEFIEIYKKNIETPIDFRTCSLKRDYQLIIPSEASWSSESWGQLEETDSLCEFDFDTEELEEAYA